jgi:hypothetical protein
MNLLATKGTNTYALLGHIIELNMATERQLVDVLPILKSLSLELQGRARSLMKNAICNPMISPKPPHSPQNSKGARSLACTASPRCAFSVNLLVPTGHWCSQVGGSGCQRFLHSTGPSCQLSTKPHCLMQIPSVTGLP